MPYTEEDKRRAAQELQNRTKQSYETKDDLGMYGDIFKPGVSFHQWKPKAGKHYFDIVPYLMTENHPLVVKGKEKAGMWGYVLQIFRHSNVGVGKDQIVCPAKTFGRPCPICEEGQLQRDYIETEAQKNAWKDKYGASKRDLYNVVVGDNDETWNMGVQVFEVSDFYMEAKLSELAQTARTGPVNYAHFSLGKCIGFTLGSDELKTISGHVFEDRLIDGKPYEITDAFLDQAHVLEDLIHVLSYDEIKKMFWGDEGPVRTQTEPSRDRLRGQAEEVKKEEPVGRSRGEVGPAPTGEAPAGEPVCPSKVGLLGVDIDKLEDCKTCLVYNPCVKEFERRKDAPVTQQSEPPRTRRRM